MIFKFSIKQNKFQNTVFFVDEASMLPTKSLYEKDIDDNLKLQAIGLDCLTKVYDTVVLTGDDSQLPPIKGTSSFKGTPIYHLTKNYRSNTDLFVPDSEGYIDANWTGFKSTTEADKALAIKVFLQGAFINPNTGEENLMRDDLRRNNLLPTTFTSLSYRFVSETKDFGNVDLQSYSLVDFFINHIFSNRKQIGLYCAR